MLTEKVSNTSVIWNVPFQQLWKKFSVGCMVFAFLILFAGKDVYTGHFLQAFDPFLLVFLCFSFASLCYHVSYFTSRESNYFYTIRQNLGPILWLNLSTAVSWLGGFYALKFIEPAVAGALNFSLSPVIVVIMAFFLRPRKKIFLMEKVSAIIILLAVGFLAGTSLLGFSSVGKISWINATMGLSASLLAGIAIAGNTVFSKRLSEAKLLASFVLASRFYLLIFLSFLCWVITGPSGASIAMDKWFAILIISLLGIIFPLLLLQKVIEQLEPITISFIIIIRPVVAYLLQHFDPRLSLSPYSLFGIATIALFIFVGIVSRKRSE